ncbi:glycosyl transferase group 1 [[Leptolyngbya] sp. PCC 7376]|uniref:glycosyltransferase family 4 protein n=1 Tax=[Leptolyngbya] sp. PCC 7376 TaxID=111781 RepID=UPI00029EFFF6|nr:glycosyltransferase family 4 protein [[Leptolyngbya] sp. PCC 7376]AFY39022.1 glycosyl transferase group 1 [[Leptolyngbya] sp. PCC 7376]
MEKNKKISIITPIFFGSGTGAATYYQLLLQSLQQYPLDFRVFSEKAKEQQCSQEKWQNFEYVSLLPQRSGKDKQLLRDIWKYILQNIKYFQLRKEIKPQKCNIFLVHTSFYNQINFFYLVINRLTSLYKDINFIADVRDVLLPQKEIPQLNKYKLVISCSKNITQYLISGGIKSKKIRYIPIPQEKIFVADRFTDETLEKFLLTDQPYIFYAGMLKESKGVDLLLKIFIEEISPKYPQLKLVLSGFLKTQNPVVLEGLKARNVVYLGNAPRSEVLALIKGASLCVNLSPVESISRFALEAIALKRPVVLPPNIPEYMEHCPEFVATSRDPKVLATQMIRIMEAEQTADYPIEIHEPERVAAQYYELFCE